MNTLKPLLIAAVLAGIGYGVYVRINGGNDAPPPGAPESWDSAPKVELPVNTAPSSPTWLGASGGAGAAPPFGNSRPSSAPPPSSGSEAPPNSPPAVDVQNAPIADAPPAGAPPESAAGPAGAPDATGNGPAPPQSSQPDMTAMQPGGAPDPAASAGSRYDTPPDQYRAAENPAASPADVPQGGFAAVVEQSRRELEGGQLALALQHLSAWYDDPRLSPNEQQQLTQLLDQVAGTVVYSTQHLLEPPYEVQPNERLEDIGQKYTVPWQLLAKINGIDDPASLRPGERLKVIRGPFSALVSLDKRQLTLLLADGSYAGRFNIGIGRDQPPREGVFSVSDKVLNPVYHGADRAVGAGDQSNPLGQRWIGLGSDLGIHGTNHPENIGRPDLPGSINLSPHDAEDVFDILSVGSKVIIRR
ncbi:MAG TPA: L,D-transpeptidase family protein [Pirellulales bacterium]|nr:L,D-transpeptidase family protein [Pirellulales bacterium]